LRFARQALGLLGLYALVTSTAEPRWVAAAVCVLVAAYLVSGSYPPGGRAFERLVLRVDGSAIIHTSQGVVHAQQYGGGWSSRLCSVVVLREVLSGRRVRCLVCSSENLPDDYRRLLVRMRTAGSQAWDRPERWL
jgi:hypothetical protein